MTEKDQIYKTLLKFDCDLYRGDLDVPTYLENHYNEYIKEIKKTVKEEIKNPVSAEVMPKDNYLYAQLADKISLLNKECKKIVEITRISRDGKTKKAYEKAYKLFALLKPYFLEKSQYMYNDLSYYRIRSGDFRICDGEDSKKKKAEMFHIKDNNRNLIGAFRYSIPGFPCLYMSNGFELAWFESGMPKRFSCCNLLDATSNQKALKLIDVSNRPVQFLRHKITSLYNAENQEELKQNYNYLLNYIIIYPLVAACSIKVKIRGEKYVEEYIIPQMLMSWIREENEYEGVIYASSLYTDLVKPISAVNIVLPVKKFRNDGLCEKLTSRFKISDIEYLDLNEDLKKYSENLKELKDFKIEISYKIKTGEFFIEPYRIIVNICETAYITYNSIIEGKEIDYSIYNLIICLNNSIRSININKGTIIKVAMKKLRLENPEISKSNLNNLSKQINKDFERFEELSSKISSNTAFDFPRLNFKNYEKI